jgi:uncharacterized protein YhfF/predicted acetyltransferase
MTEKELWHEFCKKKDIDETTPYEAWSFGGGKDSADELSDLVLQRRKFGTASAYDEYVEENALDELPQIGDYSVLLRANGEAACIIRNYDVYIRPFESVPPFHAYAEGETDRTLKKWRDIHTEFFTPNLEAIGKPLNAKSLIVCEKFTVEYAPESDIGKPDELIYVEPSIAYAKEIIAYRDEMLKAGSSFDGCFSMKRMPDPEEFCNYCAGWADPSRPIDEKGARGTVLLCIRKADGCMVGCMQVHHVLNEQMQKYTGHVGYSVRPSERRKGYATRMLAKAKDYLTSFGFSEIGVSCMTDNEASRKAIIANGGEMIETVYLKEDDVNLERYVIKL